MKEDEAIEQIREVRHQISEECGHDPRKMVEYYKELQKQHEERLFRAGKAEEVTSGVLVKA
jgi:hypothetical protein